VFDGGRIRAEIAVADARAQELLAAYRQSILGAIAEVEDALVALDREKKRGEELAAAVRANQRAAALARQLYGEGLTDFLSVLDAERSLFESQDSFVASERSAEDGKRSNRKEACSPPPRRDRKAGFDNSVVGRIRPTNRLASALAQRSNRAGVRPDGGLP
jgi:hypothetical protein